MFFLLLLPPCFTSQVDSIVFLSFLTSDLHRSSSQTSCPIASCASVPRFITIGGYRLLNSWLTHSKSTSNAPMLQLILLTLQNLPLRVEHLKQVGLPS